MYKLKLLLMVFFISLSFNLCAQSTQVSGVVLNEQGTAQPGATILEKGTNNGTITDFDGNFSFNVSSPDGTLIISYIGYETKEVQLDGSSNYIITLNPAAGTLDEVVLVGYGGVKSKDLTGSVAVVSAKDFNRGVVNSPGQLLQGKVAGVNITQGSGEPGSAIDINIRGVNTVRGDSNPLYVVDGVPLDGGTGGGEALSGIRATRPKSPLNFLNPQDIESITVLKDASATAIYGTRASNGVVLITTKQGKLGKSKFTFSTSGAISSVANEVDVLNASEFREQTRRLSTILGRDPESQIVDPNVDTDWQDEIFQSALTQSYNLGLSGGAGSTTYSVSLGYLDQEGLIKETGHENINGRINFGTSVLDDRLKFQVNVTAAELKDESQARNIVTSALRANPTSAPRNANGNVVGLAGAAPNPIAFFDLYRDTAETKRLLANFTTTFNIIEGLDYKLNLAYENTEVDRLIRVFPNTAEGGDIAVGEVTQVSGEDANSLIENYLTYNKSYDKFNFDVLLGHSYQEFHNTALNIRGTNFGTDEIDPVNNLGIVQNIESIGSGNKTRKLQSFFGRANANFLDKYLITASLRADGSSIFGSENKYGYFPSVGLGWKISEEDFLVDSDVFSNLKLRAGWGQTGNQAIPVGVTQRSVGLSFNDSFPFNGTTVVNGVNISRTPNESLKWEVTDQYNVGLDWAILGGKISGAVDYFSKTTDDLFLEVSASAPALTNTVFVNSDAEITNSGFEFAVNAFIINTDDFTLDIGGNISFIENEVKNLETDILVGLIDGPGASGEFSSIFRKGESIGSFYLPRFEGFDSNGEEILSAEPEIVGDAMPDVVYGFNVNATYKDFDLRLNFNGRSGNEIFNNTARAYSSAAALGVNGNNIFREYLNVDEDPNIAPVSSSRFIEDGSFLRLNNASLGWNIKSDSFLDNLRLYLTGQNLFVVTDYTGFDPEVNTGGGNVYGVDFGSYPRPRTIIVGVDLSF